MTTDAEQLHRRTALCRPPRNDYFYDVRDISTFNKHLIFAQISGQIKLFSHNIKFAQQLWAKLEFVNCLNGSHDSEDPTDYSWKEHESKFIPVWCQGDPLPTLKEIETLEETSTRDVKLKKGDEYAETHEDYENNIYQFDSDYSEDGDC